MPSARFAILTQAFRPAAPGLVSIGVALANEAKAARDQSSIFILCMYMRRERSVGTVGRTRPIVEIWFEVQCLLVKEALW